MQTFLHVGCGDAHKDQTTTGLNTSAWKELRLDIDKSVSPDIVGTITDMRSVEGSSVDAVFSSHNIEHLYPHEVPLALAEFKRVLRPHGFVIIKCPDLQSVCALGAEDKLLEQAYTSPAGPISPIDILYGHRPPMAAGNLYMAHHCGFTENVLSEVLLQAGFVGLATMRLPKSFELRALATLEKMTETELKALAREHFT